MGMAWELVSWGFTCVGLIVALAYIGVGATVVRAARPMSGYLLIGVGALELVMQCCSLGVRLAEPRGDAGELVAVAMPLLGTFETLLLGVLVAVAAVGLAKEARELGSPS